MPTPADAPRPATLAPARLAAWPSTRLAGWLASVKGKGWPLRLALAALYICGWSALSQIRLQPTDLERFYIPAALVALHGRPLFLYSSVHQTGYPLANGPLSVAPLVGALALASWLGWLRSMALTRLVIMAVYSVFPLLLAREALLVVDRCAPEPPRGARRLLLYEVLLVSLQLWQSMLYYGHVEQPLMLWLALAGVRALGERRPRSAGALLGLALLTRTTALTLIIPLALLPLLQRDWPTLRRLYVTVLLVVAAGLAPFALADGPDLLYSLVTFHNTVGLDGGNLWSLVSGTTLAAIGQRADGVAIVLATLVVALLLLWARPDLRRAQPAPRDLYALLALCSLCHPAFVNILWPYYFLEAYTFCAIWWLAGVGALAQGGAARWRWLLWGAAPLGATLLGQARQFALAQEGSVGLTPSVALWNLLTCTALVALMVALAWRLLRHASAANLIPRPLLSLGEGEP